MILCRPRCSRWFPREAGHRCRRAPLWPYRWLPRGFRAYPFDSDGRRRHQPGRHPERRRLRREENLMVTMSSSWWTLGRPSPMCSDRCGRRRVDSSRSASDDGENVCHCWLRAPSCCLEGSSLSRFGVGDISLAGWLVCVVKSCRPPLVALQQNGRLPGKAKGVELRLNSRQLQNVAPAAAFPFDMTKYVQLEASICRR